VRKTIIPTDVNAFAVYDRFIYALLLGAMATHGGARA